MKKVIAIMFCLVMMLSVMVLASCDDESTTDNGESVDKVNGKTALELYDVAFTKLNNLENYTITEDGYTEISVVGSTNKRRTEQVRVSKIDGQNVYYYYGDKNHAPLQGNEECWYVDGWFYLTGTRAGEYVPDENEEVVTGGNGSFTEPITDAKVKANVTYEDFKDKLISDSAMVETVLPAFTNDLLKDIKFHKSGNDYFIELTMSSEEYLRYVDNAPATLSDAKEVKSQIYFDKNGEFLRMETRYSRSLDGEINLDYFYTTVVTDIGSTVIEAPSGDFVDVTGSINL